MYMYMYMYICACISTYIYTYIYIHISLGPRDPSQRTCRHQDNHEPFPLGDEGFDFARHLVTLRLQLQQSPNIKALVRHFCVD